MKLFNEKKGLSEVVSYVLIISITLAIAAAVYFWLSSLVDPEEPLVCEDKVTLAIENYKCYAATNGNITLRIKNNGNFNISGFVLRGSDDANIDPYTNINENDGGIVPAGNLLILSKELAPGQAESFEFSYSGLFSGVPKTISLQAISQKEGEYLVCEKSIIKQPISCS